MLSIYYMAKIVVKQSINCLFYWKLTLKLINKKLENSTTSLQLLH